MSRPIEAGDTVWHRTYGLGQVRRRWPNGAVGVVWLDREGDMVLDGVPLERLPDILNPFTDLAHLQHWRPAAGALVLADLLGELGLLHLVRPVRTLGADEDEGARVALLAAVAFSVPDPRARALAFELEPDLWAKSWQLELRQRLGVRVEVEMTHGLGQVTVRPAGGVGLRVAIDPDGDPTSENVRMLEAEIRHVAQENGIVLYDGPPIRLAPSPAA